MNIDIKLILYFIAGYFLCILGALIASRFKKTGTILPGLDEFFLANRNLPTIILIFTFCGSLTSAFLVVGIPGAVFANGLGSLGFIMLIDVVLLPLLVLFYTSIRRYAREHDLLSPLECFSRSYKSKSLGLVMAVFLITFLCPYLAIQLVGLGKVLQGISGGEINYINGVGFVMGIIAVYLIFGGMRAVAYTDFIQSLAIIIGLLGGVFFFVHSNWGGFGNMFEALQASKPQSLSLPGNRGFWTGPMFFSHTIFFIAVFFQPHLMTRAMMARDDKQVRIIGLGLILTIFIALIPAGLIGLGAQLLYPVGTESNQIAGLVLADMAGISSLGICLAILMIVGVLGASMSTADSLLLSIGQVSMRDIIHPYKKISHSSQVWLTRVIMLAFLGVAFILGLNPPEIMIDLVGYSTAGTAIIIPTMLGYRWKYRSKLGAFLSILIGSITLGILAVTGLKPLGMHAGFFGLISAAFTYLVMGGVTFTRMNKPQTKLA